MATRFSENEDEAIVAEINITPLTDVALVLLIIFMISSSAMLESGFQVKLPTAKTAALAQSQSHKPLFVTLGKDGRISVNSQVATEETLKAILQQELTHTADK